MPVDFPGVAGAEVYGELCVPPNSPAAGTVQLLAHGGGHNHTYWDFPLEPERYSYVRAAVAAGYATFNVDRIAYGSSTHPPSALVTLENGARALHSVVAGLRGGAVGGHAFSRVVWVGHSIGSATFWVYATLFDDVDAFVNTSSLHASKPSWLLSAVGSQYPALLDPKFANEPWALDLGYLTTRPGTLGGLFFNSATTDPAVVARLEELKDTLTDVELANRGQVGGLPAALSPTRSIRVPTLLVVGSHDNLACGSDSPLDELRRLDCTDANVTALEAPYHSPEAQLEVEIVPDGGHDLQLHTSAPQTTQLILDWIADTND